MTKTSSNDQALQDAVGALLTIEEAYNFSERLQTIYISLHKDTDSLPLLIKQSLTMKEYERFMAFLSTRKIDVANVEAVGKALLDIKEYVLGLPVFHITLAFSPRLALVDDLRRWLASNGPGMARLQIEVDPQLVGGAVVGWGGKFYDHSLKRQLGSLFEKPI